MLSFLAMITLGAARLKIVIRQKLFFSGNLNRINREMDHPFLKFYSNFKKKSFCEKIVI